MKIKSLGIRYLEKYSEFLSKFQDEKNFHLATITQKYFYFAELQIIDFQRNCEKNFKKNRSIDYNEACYSNAFGFYALIRACLETSRILCDKMQKKDNTGKLKEYRQDNFKRIKNIIDIADDIVKHPQKDQITNKVSFYEPGGLDNFGNMYVYEWLNSGQMGEILEINPIKDCDLVYKYLENLASIY